MKKSWWTEQAVRFAGLAAIGVLKVVCLLPICIVSVLSKTAPNLQRCCQRRCNHGAWFTAFLQRLGLSRAAYSLALTSCRQICNTARVRAVEGGPPLSLLARNTSCGMAAAAVTKQHQTTSSGLSPLPFYFPCQFKELCSWVPDCFTQMERRFVFRMHREITSHFYADNCVQSMKCHWSNQFLINNAT